MTYEQAIHYLKSSGFSNEQIKAIKDAIICERCSKCIMYDPKTKTCKDKGDMDDGK